MERVEIKYFWSKESRTLNRKLAELKSKEKIKEFYWNRDLLKKSIKADNYIENKFEETRGYYKLNLEFPHNTKGFHWLLKARYGYKLDSTVLKAAKLVNPSFPDCCFCCREDNCDESLEHWLLNCSRNVNSENSGNISGNNSGEIGLNILSHEISNNSDSVNENLSVNNLSINNLSVNRFSINRSNRKCSKVFNFLLGGRRNNNRNQIEWENLCKYQFKSGSLSDIPFLAKTAALFNKVIPIVSGQRWLVINRYSTKVTKSANADNTVRQASSANDHISAYAHATERNRNSLSGSQTQ
ncbi:hypothetical protein PIROE2DRAFT_9643 [Piromyces sp. E2]|nr:hypothetical protein PIROE2DRAFT_9643 [Piromyces sp. E2]|eukprot:OUM63778.1 hypothetical protein PIROE2DRAFT_9643 [Piromyces sp. E2]